MLEDSLPTLKEQLAPVCPAEVKPLIAQDKVTLPCQVPVPQPSGGSVLAVRQWERMSQNLLAC